MTYKKIHVLFLATLLSFVGLAQSNTSSISITSGYVNEGFGVKTAYTHYTTTSQFVQVSGLLSFSKEKVLETITIPYANYTLNVGYYLTPLKTKNNSVSLAVGVGASGGYESVNNGNQELSNGALLVSKSNLIYGAFVGGDLDIYITEKFSFALQSDLYYHLGSDLGNISPYIGGGFRYFFN